MFWLASGNFLTYPYMENLIILANGDNFVKL